MTVDPYTRDPLMLPVAAELLGMSTRQLVELVYQRRIRYVMDDEGIVAIPRAVVDRYRDRSADD